MAEKVLMLALSPTMEKGTIVKWRKKEGEPVASGDILCEVETDKATMEYESVNEGTLLKIVLHEGGDAKVGEPIAIVGDKGEDVSGLLAEIGRSPAEAKQSKMETAALAAPAPGPSAGAPAASERVPSAPRAGERLPGGVKASPLARELAAAHGIDLRAVRGSGPDGRIVKRDVEAAMGGREIPAAPHAFAQRGGAQGRRAAVTPVPLETPFMEEPVSRKRRVIADRLAGSIYSAPHYYLKSSAAVDALLAARRAINEGRTRKLSLNAFLIRIAAEALRNHPAVNSSWRGATIARFQRADIGLAVAQPDGLITPIVRDAWAKGIAEIDEELGELVARALKNGLKPHEYTGATFTITNLGSYGIEEFTAIINPPGSAILAVGKAVKTVVAGDDGRFGVQTRIALTLSCDHRVVDGAVGAAFMRDLAAMIEYPIGAML